MTTLQQLGEKIADSRKKHGLSKVAVAEKSRINRNTIHNLETGTGNVELNTLIAVCDALDLDIALVPKQVSDRMERTALPKYSALAQKVAARLAAAEKKGSK